MPTLAVFAHYDPDGLVAPHVLRHLDDLAEVCDHVLVVSSAQLVDDARRSLEARAEVLARDNVGYDFGSWKDGLRHAGAWWELERVVLANDSVVGPLVPYRVILDRVHGADRWGISASLERAPHLQSYVLGFERSALAHPALRAFWESLEPPVDRETAVAHGEVGLSETLAAAGLRSATYFEPSELDERIARERKARATYLAALVSDETDDAQADAERRAKALGRAVEQRREGAAYNPMIALWDRALDRRLPFVKLETLRDDPYFLDPTDTMLATLEERFPAAFAGVRDYLARVRPAFSAAGRGRQPAREWASVLPRLGEFGLWPDLDEATTVPEREYFPRRIGSLAYAEDERWQAFAARAADFLVRTLQPGSVFDAATGAGLLVAALRERGVDARGRDAAEVALARPAAAAADFIGAGAATEIIEGHYDVVLAIGLLEQVPGDRTDVVVDRLCAAGDTVLLACRPESYDEAGAVTARPLGTWLAMFADRGLLRRFDVDTSMFGPASALLQRVPTGMRHVVAEYEDALVGLRRENEARRRTLGELEVAIASLEAQLADVRAESAERAALIESLQRRVDTELPAAVAEAERLRRRIATIEASTGYRLANGATRRMGWLKGGGGSSS